MKASKKCSLAVVIQGEGSWNEDFMINWMSFFSFFFFVAIKCKPCVWEVLSTGAYVLVEKRNFNIKEYSFAVDFSMASSV